MTKEIKSRSEIVSLETEKLKTLIDEFKTVKENLQNKRTNWSNWIKSEKRKHLQKYLDLRDGYNLELEFLKTEIETLSKEKASFLEQKLTEERLLEAQLKPLKETLKELEQKLNQLKTEHNSVLKVLNQLKNTDGLLRLSQTNESLKTLLKTINVHLTATGNY